MTDRPTIPARFRHAGLVLALGLAFGLPVAAMFEGPAGPPVCAPLCMAAFGLAMAGFWLVLGLVLAPVLAFENPVFAVMTLAGALPFAAAAASALLLGAGPRVPVLAHTAIGAAACAAGTAAAAWIGLAFARM